MQDPLIFCIFSQSNILKFSLNYEKLREVLRPFSIRAKEPLSKNKEALMHAYNLYEQYQNKVYFHPLPPILSHPYIIIPNCLVVEQLK